MEEAERNRLWIGNLDERITEYQLLKLVQKYGEIEKFDLLFHRHGPRAGKSRGYGFVTFKNKSDAENALIKLNGVQLASKRIALKWAQAVKEEEENGRIPQLPVLVGPKDKSVPENQSSKIRAIERKLKMMEQKSDLDEFLFEPAAKKQKPTGNETASTKTCLSKKV